MKSMMKRTTIREIKNSLGRYLSIFAIVALGVGFFAGVRVTKTAMLATGNDYFRESKFFDFRLLSTLGFDEEDLAVIKTADGVATAEGAVAVDFFAAQEDGVEYIVKAHSITTDINTLILREGSMPKSENECVVDVAMRDTEIGDVLTISNTNTEETIDSFSQKEYKIVGKVQSPLYINFERGNTTIGNGKITFFAYFLPEAFTLDYYTEIYLSYNQKFEIYSEEYDDFIESKENEITALCESRADIRYETIYNEADEQIRDGEKEIADAKKELADAKQEIEDSEKELEDGKEEISENEKKLADARIDLKKGEEELADGKIKLADGEKELADGRTEIEKGEKELADNRLLLEEAIPQVQRGRLTYEEGLASWKEGARQLTDSKKQLDESAASLSDGWEQYYQGVTALGAMKGMQLDTATGYAAAEQAYVDLGNLMSSGQGLTQEQQQQYALLSQIIPTIQAALEGTTPDDAMLSSIVTPIFTGMEQQLATSNATLTAGQAEYEKGLEQYNAAETTIGEAKNKLDFALTQVQKGETELADATGQFEEGVQKLEDAKAELKTGETELEDARIEITDAEKQIADAKIEIADGSEKLEDGKKELADGEQKLADGKKEYEDAKKDADIEIADAEADIQKAKEELAELAKPEYFELGRNTNVGFVCFENDSDIVESISTVFPVFFFLIAALVCATTMNRMVEEQRTQIGILKALGYGKNVIMSKYMFYSGSAAILGCVIGFTVGSYIFPLTIWQAYGMMYDFSRRISFILNTKLFIISVIGALLCSVGTTYFSCRYELNTVTAQLIRPKSPKNGKRIFLEYIPFLWSHMKFLYKVSARNVVRYKKRFFMMILGIGGCSALLLTGFGLKDSVGDVVTQQYENIQLYDINVNFKEPPTKEQKEEFFEQTKKDMSDILFATEENVDIEYKKKIKSATLIVPEKPEQVKEFINLSTSDKEPLSYPGKGEVILTEKMAKNLGIEVGNEIILRDGDQKEIKATVIGLTENFVANYAYIHPDTYTDDFKKPFECKTLYAAMKEGKDYNQVAARLLNMDNVSGATANEMIKERFGNMIMSLNYIVLLIIICAGALAFIVLYNLTNINITERIREIATIKVLGFYPMETAAYVFRENFVLTGIGGGVGLILGYFLHAFVMFNIKLDAVSFDIKILPLSYLYSILLTFGFALVVNIIMYYKLKKINMAESLKSIE